MLKVLLREGHTAHRQLSSGGDGKSLARAVPAFLSAGGAHQQLLFTASLSDSKSSFGILLKVVLLATTGKTLAKTGWEASCCCRRPLIVSWCWRIKAALSGPRG